MVTYNHDDDVDDNDENVHHAVFVAVTTSIYLVCTMVCTVQFNFFVFHY